MKRFLIISMVLLLTDLDHPVFAKRRASRQDWIQRKNDLKPEQLKKLVEENHQFRYSNQQLIEELDISQQELERLLKLKAKINALRKKKGVPQPWDNEKYKDLKALFTVEQQGDQGLAEENEQLRLDVQKLAEEVSLTRKELKELLRLKTKIDALRKRKGIPKSLWDNKKYKDLDKIFTTEPRGDQGLAEENEQLRLDIQKLVEEVSLTRKELKNLLKLKAKIDAIRKQKGHTTSWDNDNYSDLDVLFSSNQQQKVVTAASSVQSGWGLDENRQPYNKGVVFKVQIGAYRKRDLSDILEDSRSQEVFEQEQKKGVNKYTLRHFRNYQRANRFKKELRAMGLKDAWIVPFRDGQRVLIKSVLNEIRSN